MNAGDLCTRDVVVATADTSAIKLAQLMREFHVGDIVIVRETQGERHPIGIVTDRDIVLELTAKDVAAEAVLAGDIMTAPLVVVYETDTAWDTLQRLRAKAVRRIPVVNKDGGLIGIVTADDLVEFLAEELREIVAIFSAQRRREQRVRP